MRDNNENRLEDVAREAIEKGAARKITIVWSTGATTKLKAPPCRQSPSVDENTPDPDAQREFALRDIHTNILAVLTDQPQTAKAIAHRAGYRSLQRVYQALRQMVDAGRIVHSPEGFNLAREHEGE